MKPNQQRMAVSVPPAIDAVDRARRIITAANGLLEENGLEGLTIRAVLARTGLARRAFYESFAGKDDLVLAVFERTLQGAANQFRCQTSGLADALERIRTIVTGIILGRFSIDSVSDGSDRRSAALSREHLRLAEARPRELDAALRPLLELIAEQVAEGVRTGQLRHADPALQAALIYNLVATTTHTELLTHEGPIERERRTQLADHMWEFCRRAIIA